MRHLIWVLTACKSARFEVSRIQAVIKHPLAKCACILLTHFQHRVMAYIPRTTELKSMELCHVKIKMNATKIQVAEPSNARNPHAYLLA